MRKKPNLLSILLLAVMLFLVVVLCIKLVPLLENVIKNAGDESKMVTYIEAYGARGVPELIALTALQVITVFIPRPLYSCLQACVMESGTEA